ncbi:MAG: hypothetical protein LUD78_05260, partial [Clostridiales bacterium]|nr:hypothetical protein [Clostridiales bacterium]
MKKQIQKRIFSALCLTLALCMASYPAALAQETAADSSAVTAAAAADADDTDDTAAAPAEESSGAETAPETAQEETDASPAEATDDTEEAPSAADDDSGEEAEPASGAEAESETSVLSAAAQEESVSLTSEAGTGGWTQTDDGWTFLYWEDNTSSTSVQATDIVLYLSESATVDGTTFAAGYYYFDEDGTLSLTGTGFVTAISLDEDGKALADASADSSGKLATVTTTQSDSSYSSTVVFYTGSYDSLYYSNGSLYTGYYSTGGVLYYVTDGVGSKYTGQYTSGSTSTYGSTTYTGDGLWYYNGSKFTGYVRRYSSDYVWYVKNGVGGTKLTGQMSSSTAYVRMDTGAKSTGDGLWYYKGEKFTGYVRRYSGDYVWVVKSGKGGTKLTGTMSKSTAYVRMDTGAKSTGDGKYYKSGKLYSGVVGSYYYKKGVKQTSLRGWQTFDDNGNTSSKSSANTYYFTSSGKVYKSCWKNLKRNGTTYRFYFNSDGTLCKNLYKVSSAWKKKATKLVISRSTHTATLYAKYNGSYKIPTKSFVVSTSRSASNFKVGTYKLTSRQSWFTISSANWWYKWATYISGSGSWCHSEQYYTKGNSKSLRVSSYNDLGTNQSKQCIRMQVVNAK